MFFVQLCSRLIHPITKLMNDPKVRPFMTGWRLYFLVKVRFGGRSGTDYVLSRLGMERSVAGVAGGFTESTARWRCHPLPHGTMDGPAQFCKPRRCHAWPRRRRSRWASVEDLEILEGRIFVTKLHGSREGYEGFRSELLPSKNFI